MVEKQGFGHVETLEVIWWKEQLNQLNSLLPPEVESIPEQPPPALPWLSHSLDWSLNHLDLPKQQKIFYIFSFYKKNQLQLEESGNTKLGQEKIKNKKFPGQGTEKKYLGKEEETTEAFAHVQEH